MNVRAAVFIWAASLVEASLVEALGLENRACAIVVVVWLEFPRARLFYSNTQPFKNF